MEEPEWEFIIANDDVREDVFVEIWIEDEIFCLVHFEDKSPTIIFYSRLDNKPWAFQYSLMPKIFKKIDEFINAG